VNGDSSKEPIFINARVGTPVMLSSAGTSDPDGKKVKYTLVLLSRGCVGNIQACEA
jgi:hypothetical protein